MEASLLVLNGKNSGLALRLNEETLVGRSGECGLRPSNPEVSRKHCRILLENEQFFIEDLGSLNGTFVNDERISSKTVLVDGDYVIVGTLRLMFTFSERKDLDEVVVEKGPIFKTTEKKSFFQRFSN